MNPRLSKLARLFFLGMLVAAFTLTACNNKKKEDKEVKKEDTVKEKPVQPGDLNAPTGDTTMKNQ